MTNKEQAAILSGMALGFSDGITKEKFDIAMKMAQWKDRQNIADLGGWQTEEPAIDCFCLVDTKDFPKNCHYIVAEWDNDAKRFYSESSDMPISFTRYKIIEPNNFLMNR